MIEATKLAAFLNGINCYDKAAIGELIKQRVKCGRGVEDHPTLVPFEQDGQLWLGLLGVLNGLCSEGRVAAIYDGDTLVGFGVQED